MLTVLAPRVAALTLQDLKALHARPLLFKVENLVPSLWQRKLGQAARNPHAGNPHAGNLFINVPKA